MLYYFKICLEFIYNQARALKKLLFFKIKEFKILKKNVRVLP